jgi:hypothetical protein
MYFPYFPETSLSFFAAQALVGPLLTIPTNPMEEMMNVKRITPVLFVKEIEPVLPSGWTR